MNTIWAILRKEVRTYFNSFIAYALTAFYLIVNGLIFAGTLGEASLRNILPTMGLVLIFVLPFLAMRLLAEEEASGTVELLMTAPVRDWEVVVGKYLAALVAFLVMLAFTLWFPFMLFRFGNPDPGPIASGYLGLFLIGAVVLAVGMFFSALTRYQVVAGLSALGVLLVLYIIDLAGTLLGPVLPAARDLVSNITLNGRAQDMWAGVIDTKDIVYFVSVVFVMLFITTLAVQSRRWR